MLHAHIIEFCIIWGTAVYMFIEGQKFFFFVDQRLSCWVMYTFLCGSQGIPLHDIVHIITLYPEPYQ